MEYIKIPVTDFSVEKTFDCGQCFRFDPVNVVNHKTAVGGVAFGKYVIFAQDSPDELYIYGATDEDFEHIWRHYLALDTDYTEIIDNIKKALPDSAEMAEACEVGRGIRILRQEPWETVCSFIISQNNNIPRIKKLVSAVCERWGEKIDSPYCENAYSFPSAQILSQVGEAELLGLKVGFRAKYIDDAAKRFSSGEITADEILNGDFDYGMSRLTSIKGIGPKVASCSLLFGFNKTGAFPIDVWIKRVLEKYFPNGIDIAALGDNAGIAQQFLFYYERYNVSRKENLN